VLRSAYSRTTGGQIDSGPSPFGEYFRVGLWSNTWLRRPAMRVKFFCQRRAVHTWHFAEGIQKTGVCLFIGGQTGPLSQCRAMLFLAIIEVRPTRVPKARVPRRQRGIVGINYSKLACCLSGLRIVRVAYDPRVGHS
jgi:hypothetical protein